MNEVTETSQQPCDVPSASSQSPWRVSPVAPRSDTVLDLVGRVVFPVLFIYNDLVWVCFPSYSINTPSVWGLYTKGVGMGAVIFVDELFHHFFPSEYTKPGLRTLSVVSGPGR